MFFLFVLALSRIGRGEKLNFLYFLDDCKNKIWAGKGRKEGTSILIVDQFSFPLFFSAIIASLCLPKSSYYDVPKRGCMRYRVAAYNRRF